MRHKLLLLLLLVLCICPAHASSDILSKMVSRLLPGYQSQFVFRQEASQKQVDYFEISASQKKILIKGNSPVSMAAGFNWYLKYTCHASTSWCGDQLKLPKKLPLPIKTIRQETPLHVGFYLNYCTFCYSMPFWGWKEWEKEIDRMAMSGINTPLAIVGVESVWRNTLRRFNYTDEEIKKFIPGPTYLGWFLMDNLEGVGGPLSDSWFTRQEELQKKILARMREYGMTPVFQSFFGMVPTTLQAKYPEADIVAQGKWADYERPPMLNPSDPLFEKMSTVWYEEYQKLYGTTKYYGGDPFHEGGRPGHIDLKEAAHYIQTAMQKAVPGSIWILQAWGDNPTEKLLSGTNKKDVMIVDLCAEYWDRWNERKAFGGYPWVWGNITNWGGNIALHGRLDAIASEPTKARNMPAVAPLLRGIANVPEGIGTNPVAFDMACEMRWRDSIPSVDKWLHGYAAYRYGKSDKTLETAWEALHNTAYGTYPGSRRPTESVLCAVPSLKVTCVSPWGSTRLYYQQDNYRKALELFNSARTRFKGCDTYEYDLVDFTRQLVANEGRILYDKAMLAYNNKKADSLAYYENKFLQLILLQDRLLSCRPELCASTWIAQARNCVSDNKEKDLYELNARALITTWSDGCQSLLDYAHREWNGMMKYYYYPRWKMFFDWLNQTVEGKDVPKPDYTQIENNWVHSKADTSSPREDLYKIVDECINFK